MNQFPDCPYCLTSSHVKSVRRTYTEWECVNCNRPFREGVVEKFCETCNGMMEKIGQEYLCFSISCNPIVEIDLVGIEVKDQSMTVWSEIWCYSKPKDEV